MSKVTTYHDGEPAAKFDELRTAAQTDYFDIMLLHWQHTPTWTTDSRRWQDGIEAAQEKKIILHRGASVHGLPALRQVPTFNWLDVAMIRMNHNGSHMDAEDYNSNDGNVPEVVQHVHKARAAGQGIISMKLIGEGSFNHEDRQKAMRYAFQTAKVDSVTVGYKTPQEVDEAIDNLNLALA
jgi:predicted aldo/keto reductase-like oxidoreductase